MPTIEDRTHKWLLVQAYKHDGSFHRMWSPAYLVEENDCFWALASKASAVIEGDGRNWATNEPAIFFLFKKRWLNIIAMQKTSGIVYYVNIASPTIKDDDYLRYIDYDLDLKLYTDDTIKELDVQEYQENTKLLKYSKELQEKIIESFKEVEKEMKNHEFPFDPNDVLDLFMKAEEENQPYNPTFKKN